MESIYKLAVEYYDSATETESWESAEDRVRGLILFNIRSEETEVREVSKSVIKRLMALSCEQIKTDYTGFYKVWASGDQYWFKVLPKDSEISDLIECETDILFDKDLNDLEEVPCRSNIFDELLEGL